MSCLFEALSSHLDINSDQVRSMICEYLSEQKPILDAMSTCDVMKYESGLESSIYISNMRRSTTWGGAIEIQTACNIWGLRVLVDNTRDSTRIEFIPLDNNTGTCKTVRLQWNGSHYAAIL